ncbi:TPA: LPD38 domain-containing protein [Yersinia enterocolitica]
MTYDPQQQRPEEQTNNSNRETLNIQQPGENANTGFDWGAVRAAREAAGRQSKAPQENDPSVGLKDVAFAAATAPSEIIHGLSQMVVGADRKLDRLATEKPRISLDVDPELLNVIRKNPGNDLPKALGKVGVSALAGISNLAGDVTDKIKSNYSEGAKQAAEMPFIETDSQDNLKLGAGAFDKDAWVMNAVPTLSQLFSVGGFAKLGGKVIAKSIEELTFQKLKNLLPEFVARETAKETAIKAGIQAQKSGFVGIMAGTAQGSSGNEMRDEINALPFDQLVQSPTFQKAFSTIDSDPNNSALSDTQKLTLARNQVAEQAASSVTVDPRMLAINIAASTLGDHTLLNLLTKKGAASGVISGASLGAAAEGGTEFTQGAAQRYVQNQQLIDTAGQKIDPMKGVVETGANNAVLGAGIGGAAGTIGGIRGRRSAAEATSENPVNADGSPVSENIDPSQQQEVTPQAENQSSPEVAVQQNSVSENGVPNSQIDDFRDTPAYLRQDPRVQGFADDSDVQRSLAEPEAQPTAQDLIQQQMESGEQGFTPDELSILQQADQIRAQRTPRLPAPGNIHPGEGFPMPGPIQGDEPQAGSAPQFTAGEQTRGQVYLPREQAEQQGAVRETHTYDGQTDPQAITDKNIIFADGPVVNPDDVQSGKAPQFEGGQRKDVRRFTEAMGAQSETAITDQRQRAGGVPIDARTEAYAKGETLGELRLHHGKPFPNEKVARFTKWAKMPGAVIEPVGDGFGVRLPAKSTDSGIASTKEGHIESGTPQGELRLHHGKPFPNEKVARFTKWAKMPGAVIEPVGDGFGVRLPPEPTTENTKTAPSNEGVVASGEQQVGELRLHLGKPFNSEKVAKYSKWGRMPGATIEPVGKGYGVRLPVPEPVGQAKNRDAKIDDFGEELKGAAKHKWGQLAESLKADHDIEEIKKQPLSKLFPHPDYTKMHENGIEPEKLALLAALRSFIPTKPGSPYKLNQWAEQVKGVRDLASSIINSHASVDDIKTIFRSKSSLRSAADTIDLISQFKPAQMAEASKYTIHSGHYTYFDGKSYPGGKTLYQLVVPRGVIANISAGSMAELLPKAKAFIETQLNSDKGEAAPKQAKLEIYTRRADKSVFIGYKGAMGVLPLKAGFKTPNEARAYLAENRAEIEAKLDKLRKVSREEQRKATNEPRTGIERRKGTAATLEHGLPRYNKAEGIVERQSGTGKEDALMGILDGLGNHRENFFKWIAGHRSERLMKEGKENNFNADEIAYMKTLNRGNEALFEGQKKKYDAFIKSILDLQQDMGLIDPESRAQWEDAWYLPYYREAENGEVKGPWTSKGIANQSSTVRKLKGSDLTIKDPIENLFNYVAKSVDASMKNEAMRRSVVNLADTGVLEVIESPNKMDFERIGKDVVKVFVDGQEKLVQVNDPELYRAFTMIDLERSNSTFMKAARQAKKVLTVSTTSMPDFIIRNFMRDSIHSWAINKDGFKPVIASWAGFKKALRTDDSLVDMMFAGATFGGGYSNVYDPASTAKTIRSVLRRKGYNDSQIQEFESSIVRNSKEVMGKIEQGLHKYKNLSETAENANRLATYEAAIKSGKSKAQAAFESRDLMDFSMMGASNIMINLSDMLPFFNARMQGLSKLGRGIKENPREVLKRGGMITAASLALMALNWDDKRYEELQDWDKDTYWHAWIGGQHIRFPKPFEIGLMFGTLPERFIRALGGKDTGAKFGKLVAHNFMETMAFNPIPQVAMPIAEAYVNYDFFKGGPIENMADSNLMAGARYNDQTSLLMREVGQATNMSPKMLDHIVMGYTGSLGGYVMGATNLLMRNLKDYGETPTMRLDELPVIRSFFRGSDPAKSTQFTEDFYRMMTEANQINSTINSFRKQGRGDDANELIEENRGKLSQREGLTATQKQVKALNAQIEMMRRDRILTADQKREKIDRLMATRNKLVQQAVERVNPYFNK